MPSRLAIGAAAGLGLAVAAYSWHLIDRRAAVTEARTGYVLAAERDAALAELDALRKAQRAAAVAAEGLRGRVAEAEAEAEARAAQLEDYRLETTVDPACVVGPDLLRRLRAN
ncbi:hypothetical protein [Pararhodobacter zhoushanensis]|uniref:hypothetical protein n=1 Tax=Pararhodobacter zhoushanensis TaxID=2479545 RepID=UPI000F8F684D|nr:hypothetical protein [Pararhodobacter zhoushanensis]